MTMHRRFRAILEERIAASGATTRSAREAIYNEELAELTIALEASGNREGAAATTAEFRQAVSAIEASLGRDGAAPSGAGGRYSSIVSELESERRISRAVANSGPLMAIASLVPLALDFATPILDGEGGVSKSLLLLVLAAATAGTLWYIYRRRADMPPSLRVVQRSAFAVTVVGAGLFGVRAAVPEGLTKGAIAATVPAAGNVQAWMVSRLENIESNTRRTADAAERLVEAAEAQAERDRLHAKYGGPLSMDDALYAEAREEIERNAQEGKKLSVDGAVSYLQREVNEGDYPRPLAHFDPDLVSLAIGDNESSFAEKFCTVDTFVWMNWNYLPRVFEDAARRSWLKETCSDLTPLVTEAVERVSTQARYTSMGTPMGKPEEALTDRVLAQLD